MEATTAPIGLRNASLRWKSLRITCAIRPVKELLSTDTSKEALRMSGSRANSCVFYETLSESGGHGHASRADRGVTLQPFGKVRPPSEMELLAVVE